MASSAQASHHPRRAWLTRSRRRMAVGLVVGISALGLLGGTLTGCGFQLRRSYDMSFKTVQLTGFAGNSSLATELARALEASGVDVVDSTLAATQAASATTVPTSHIVLQGLLDKRDMLATNTTAYGQVRIMTARNFLRFQIKRGDGTILLGPTDVTLTRELTYNEKDALAKQDESSSLHKAMQSDIVNQVMRRLAAIKPAQLVSPPVAVAPAVVHAASAPASAASE